MLKDNWKIQIEHSNSSETELKKQAQISTEVTASAWECDGWQKCSRCTSSVKVSVREGGLLLCRLWQHRGEGELSACSCSCSLQQLLPDFSDIAITIATVFFFFLLRHWQSVVRDNWILFCLLFLYTWEKEERLTYYRNLHVVFFFLFSLSSTERFPWRILQTQYQSWAPKTT